MSTRQLIAHLNSRSLFGLCVLVLLLVPQAASAQSMTVEPITWNIIGLDSNDVMAGPNRFPVGARVCASGSLTNVQATFVWDTPDPLINLRAGSNTTIDLGNLPGTCADAYFEVEVTRDAAAYENTAGYHIAVTANGGAITGSTPTPREVYVERLVSQARNAILDMQYGKTIGSLASVANGGSMTLVVGETYFIRLIAATATQGYEQLESFVSFPNTVFQVLSVSSEYSASTSPNVPQSPTLHDMLYADGCTWENDPNSPNYRACLGSGKAGGSIEVTYEVKILSLPVAPFTANPEPLNSLVHDFSGSSFHYNADFDSSARFAAIVDPTTSTIEKSFSPNPTNVGGISALTITLSNPNPGVVSGYNFVDGLPANLVVATPNGATMTGCGAPSLTAVAGSSSITFANGTIGALGTCLIKVNVTPSAAGTLTNTTDNLFIGTIDTGSSASADLEVNTTPPPPPPPSACTAPATLATWTMPAAGQGSGGPPPPYTTKAVDVSTATASFASVSGVSSISNLVGNPVNAWGGTAPTGTDGWAETATSMNNYFQFVLDTSNYGGVFARMDARPDNPGNWANPNSNVFINTSDGGAFTPYVPVPLAAKDAWTTFTTSAVPTGTATTTFRVGFDGSGNKKPGATAYLDNVVFQGCPRLNPPTITKAFSLDPIAVNGVTTLTFTLANPNASNALNGVTFTDLLPAGLQVAATPAASTTCGGTPTWAPVAGATELVFGAPTGASIPLSSSCTVSVNVTATQGGAFQNISSFVSSSNGGTNSGASGIATASLTVIAPPSIEKLFAPNPVLQGGTSTLTFTVANPNTSNPISGVAFSDTFPIAPAAMVVANPTGASTSGCGTPTFSPVAGAAGIAFSGGTIAANGTCTVTVNVTAPTTGAYPNTSGAVSHIVNGSPVNGNTASDSLQVDSATPGISFGKQVGTTAMGPWLTTLSIATGAEVYYLLTVENTGDVPLSPVSVSDPNVSTAGCTFTNPLPVAVAANENHITTCVVGPILAVAGTHSNTATASGTFGGTPYTDTDTATYQTIALSIVKSVVQKYFTKEGQIVDYQFAVTNTGAATLSSLTILDDKTSDEGCPSFTTALPGDGDNFFDAGETVICTATHAITAAEFDAGSVTNTASASSGGVSSGTSQATVDKAAANYGHLPTDGAVIFDGNLFSEDGASHITGGTYLGAGAPTEADGTNGLFAPEAADDGAIFSPGVLWKEGTVGTGNGGSIDATVQCAVATCFLAAWIDWDNDGAFGAGETISGTTWPVVDGPNTITFDIPILTVDGALLDGSFYVRYRLYEEDPGSTLAPFGQATNAAGTVGTVGEVEDYFYTANAGVLTPVTISYVHARRFGAFTRIEWSTSTESANVGFNIYARKGRELVRVNSELIPSSAIDSLNRLDYSFDAPVDAGHFFIEEVDVLGKARRHGPYEADVEHGSRLEADTIDWASIRKEAAAPLARSAFEKASGPGSAVTMKVRETGFHRVSYESLRAAGIDWTGVQANDISVTLRGVAIPIHVDGGPMFGPGSFVEFHAEALDTIYTDTNVYRLDTTGPRSPRIRVNAGLPGLGLDAPESYSETVLVDRQKAYANYAPGEDAWYDTSMLVFKASKKFKFQFAVNGLADPNASSTMDLVLWGVTAWPQSPDHSVVVFVNGTRVGYKKFDGLVELTLNLEIPRRVLHEGTNTLEVQMPGDTVVDYDLVNLDRFSVTYPRLFNALNGRLSFDAESKVFRVGNLPTSDVVIYRSEGGEWVRQRAFVERGVGNSFIANFAGSNDPARYFVSSAETMHVPELAPARTSADLDGDAEYLVIAHPSFIGGLEPLLDARRAQGLTVSVVDVNDLYERYTSGVFDPDAIKQHVAYAVKELGTRFVLLVGGDTYDYRDYLAKESVSFIPSLYASTSETVKFVPVDPRYGDVDGDDVPDVAIGRFPVRTAAELELMIRKTLHYESKDYRRTALFVSDEFDGYESFKSISTSLAAGLPAGWASENVHLDDTSVAAAREQLLAGMNRGTSLVTFTGHSGPVEWTFDGLFNTKHAAALTNEGKPFVVVQWGCWNTYYVEPVNNYLVHSFLFSGDRGAAAVLGASTLTDSVSERMLGNLLTPRITTPGMPIGQALVDAKQELAKQHPEMLDVILGWSLMGDPALVVEP